MTVVVYGSANVDRVYRVPQIPSPGQTVLATGREQYLGGKGNNQAIAAARAGAHTRFITALGDDEPGTMINDGLTADGVDPLIRWMDERSGNATIVVDPAGENSIVVDAGAYGHLSGLQPEETDAVATADMLLMQAEIPITAVQDAAQRARDHQTTTVLNAAPMTTMPSGLLQAIDLLIVNETEAQQLLGTDEPSADALEQVAPAVIMTLGSRGSLVVVRNAGSRTVDAQRVEVTDTTGAGDTFCGALVAEIDHRFAGKLTQLPDLVTATEFATAASALSVQRAGAVPSIPSRPEIEASQHVDD